MHRIWSGKIFLNKNTGGIAASAMLCAALALVAPVGLPAQNSPQAPAPVVPSLPPADSNAPAQAPPPQNKPNQIFNIGTISVNEVNLIFVVQDGKGRFINDVQQQDLALLDDGKPPERVIHFTHETNLPLRLGLMIDTSSSIRQRFDFEQQAAKEFLLSILNPMRDEAFIEGFDIQIELSQGFTNNPSQLDSGISKLRPGGGTALYDSLYRTCRDQMLNNVPGGAEVRKAIVMLSDGDDNFSRSHIDDAIKECQRADTIVYTISTDVSPSKDKGDDVLKKISEETGGRAFFPQQIEDIASHFSDIKAELGSQYSLEYVPADFKQDGSYRSIYLVDNAHRNYKVRVHKGYFAKQQ